MIKLRSVIHTNTARIQTQGNLCFDELLSLGVSLRIESGQRPVLMNQSTLAMQAGLRGLGFIGLRDSLRRSMGLQDRIRIKAGKELSESNRI